MPGSGLNWKRGLETGAVPRCLWLYVSRQLRKAQSHVTNHPYFFLAIGAILGATTRYWLGGWVAQKWGTSFPYGNLVINLSGSFLLAFFMTLSTERFVLDPRWRLFLALGFLSSYTTFSSYIYESLTLMASNHWRLGFINLFGSSVLGLLAALLGMVLGQML